MAFTLETQLSGPKRLQPSQISLLHPWLVIADENDIFLRKVGIVFENDVYERYSQPIRLPSPHVQRIAAISYQRVEGTDSLYLVSVSHDSLVVWKNPQLFEVFDPEEENELAEEEEKEEERKDCEVGDEDTGDADTMTKASFSSFRSQKIASGPYVDVTHVTLSPRGTFVSVASGNDAVIVSVVNGAEAKLTHRKSVLQTVFVESSLGDSYSSSSTISLISICADASLRLWDVKTMTCSRVCDSVFRLSSPLTCLRASVSTSSLIKCFVGDADGNLFTVSFQKHADNEASNTSRIDLKSHLEKARRRRQRKKMDKGGRGGGDPDADDVVPGCDVLAIEIIDERLLLIALSSAIVIFDVFINECLSSLSFPDKISVGGDSQTEKDFSLPISSSISISNIPFRKPEGNSACAFLATVATFSGLISILRAKLPPSTPLSSSSQPQDALEPVAKSKSMNEEVNNQEDYVDDEDSFTFPDISVVATNVLTEGSALKTDPLLPISDSNESAKKLVKPKPSAVNSCYDSKKYTTTDKPVVVRDKVKSSGYSAPPRNMKMFQPNTDFSNAKRSSSSKQPSKPKPQQQQSKTRATDTFPSDASPPSSILRDICLSESRATPVSSLSVSSCGANVACGVTDYNITIVGESLAEKSVTSHAGHKGIINVANWSLDGAWLISASSDKTAAVWRKSAADPTMVFEDRRNNFAVDKVTPKGKDQQPFPSELRHAQFYYLDKFILIASANKLFLYVHFLDASKNDLQRYKTGSRYKLVKEYEVEDVQAIMAASTVNAFYSHLVLSACSNKSIDVLDLNVGRSLLRIEDAHETKIHTVAQNQGSRHSALSSSEAYNLFLSGAVGSNEGVKLWDLRSPRYPVRLFNQHVNRILPTCSSSFSPCGRFVASGSEDCHAYLYDVGTGRVVQKYRAKDGGSVTHVAFHPLHMKLFMATLNGTLYLVS